MKRESPLAAVAVATLAVLLSGCSRSPIAPVTDSSAAHGAGAAVLIPDDAPPSSGGTPLSRTVSLVATDEGLAVVGRWTLWIRKNSLKMPATITLRVSDPEAMDVHIEVSPPQANDFQSPVVLTANLSDVPNVDYSNETMLYWNGTWLQWTDVSAHLNQENVVAHFKQLPSRCMVAEGSGRKGKLGA